MSILDFLRKDEVRGAKVLVCALGRHFEGILNTDSEVYGRHYRATTTAVLPSIRNLLDELEKRYDIVHLITAISGDGTIKDDNDMEITGTEIIQRCCDHDVKLLWSASDNPAEGYIRGFRAKGKRLNLAMTINRKGSDFCTFLQQLLSRMADGDTMPTAWNDLCPQIPGSDHPRAPETIFFAGRPAVRLLA
jgi:hypothetical protein